MLPVQTGLFQNSLLRSAGSRLLTPFWLWPPLCRFLGTLLRLFVDSLRLPPAVLFSLDLWVLPQNIYFSYCTCRSNLWWLFTPCMCHHPFLSRKSLKPFLVKKWNRHTYPSPTVPRLLGPPVTTVWYTFDIHRHTCYRRSFLGLLLATVWKYKGLRDYECIFTWSVIKECMLYNFTVHSLPDIDRYIPLIKFTVVKLKGKGNLIKMHHPPVKCKILSRSSTKLTRKFASMDTKNLRFTDRKLS